jgi:Rrf2 family protein
MLLNRSAQYSLLALIYLARQPEGRYVMTRDVADALSLPQPFLAKVLQPMTRRGWLLSSRGRFGGVTLAEATRAMSILQIIEHLDNFGGRRDCLLGLRNCDDTSACVLHCQWQPIKDELRTYLASHNLAQMADDPHAGLVMGGLAAPA